MAQPALQKPTPYSPSKPSPGILGNNWLLAIAVLLLALFPLVFVRGEYSGSDNQAQGAIQELHPTYVRWFWPLFKPASGEIEGLLFASQAALGAGVLGYVIGRYKGRSEQQLGQSGSSDPSSDQASAQANDQASDPSHDVPTPE
jgi:cobalt/nickel transport protein